MGASLKTKTIKAFVSGVSGVLHNNQDIVGELDSKPFRGFLRSHYDGQGVSLLRAIGIHVCFVSIVDKEGDTDPFAFQLVERWNSLPSSFAGWPPVNLIHAITTSTVAPVNEWLSGLGLTFDDCAVMGHDLGHIPLLKRAGYRVVPAQAEDVAKKEADMVTSRPGGNGALRDFANAVLAERDIDPTTLPTR